MVCDCGEKMVEREPEMTYSKRESWYCSSCGTTKVKYVSFDPTISDSVITLRSADATANW